MNEITTDNIKKQLEENEIMLIQFWAPWCAPCRALTPTIDELEDNFGKEIIGRCNTDENQDLAMDYFIRSIPTVIIFKDGEEVERLQAASKSTYTDKLNYYLSASLKQKQES